MTIFPIVFTPSAPVEFGGNTYRRLTFSRPISFAEILAAEPFADPIEKMSAVAASLAGVPAAVIHRMSVEDQIGVSNTIEPILALPPAIEA